MRTLSLVSLVVVLVAGLAAQGAPVGPYTVAYASFGPVNSAIYVADADGRRERMLVAGPVLDMNPSFAPDGQSVLFTSRRDGSADIYRVRVDGTGLERLTDDPAFDDQAVMAPDGRSVAFVSSRSGQADIWVLDLLSKRARNLTNHPGGDYRPAWSPDGRWIAFTSDRDSDGARAATPRSAKGFSPLQSTQIYVVRADGSSVRGLTSGSTSVGGASWSPDGTEIVAYEATIDDWRAMNTDFSGPAATSQIVSINVATGARQPLTSGPGRKYGPAWRGRRVAYLHGAVNETRGVRERVNFESAGIGFTDGSVGPSGVFSHVSWSADGTRMVYNRPLDQTWPPVRATFSRDPAFRVVRTGIFPSYTPDGRSLMVNTAYAAIFHNTVAVMNTDGANRRVVFDDPTQNAVAPVWSPTGDRIAFGLGRYNTGTVAGAVGHVAITRADGSGLRLLTDGRPGNHGFPSWSPDGRRMVFRTAIGGTGGLAIADVASGDVTPLTSGSWHDNFPAWSPTGDLILFSSDRDGDWELYTIRPDGRDLKRLTSSPGNDAHAAWSFDGGWIAFSSARGGFKDEMPVGEGGGQGAGDIFVMRRDGSDVRRLTDDAFEEATPAFSPTPR